MIRAIRPNAMARDDARLVSGWNIAPNLAYTVVLLPGSASCGVLLYGDDGSKLIAYGAALTGAEQSCVLVPQTGQTVGMVDAALGWHLLLTTTGTESQRTIRIGPAVDLPDEIHPVYGDDDMALARATAAIDGAAHYIDDVTVTCPLGLGAGLGDVVSVPVDGVAIVGQVESITWTATPDGTTETAVIRRHVEIAPEVFVEPTPPTVANDAGTATHLVGTSGNVLANDETGLIVTAVNGLSSNVGTAVDGDNGGTFTINTDGSWTFSPDGDFALLSGSETADTSVTYHASDGTAEAMATLTVTVSHQNAAPVAVDDTGETDAATTTSGNVLINDTDGDGDTLAVSQVAGSAGNIGVAVAGSGGGLFTIASDGAWTFDPDGDFAALEGSETADTSVTYYASDGVSEAMATLTVTVSSGAVVPSDPYWDQVAIFLNANDQESATPSSDLVGNAIAYSGGAVIDSVAGYPAFYFDGSNDFLSINAPSGGWGLNNQYTLDWYAYTDSNNKLGGINIGRYQASGGWFAGSTFSIRDSLNPPFFYFHASGGTQEFYNSWTRTTVANTLYHFALVRDGSVAKFYINGILTWTRTGLTLCVESTLSFILGKWDYVDVPEWVKVRIPWLRLTRAIRWTENFTPPDRLIST